MKNLTDDQIVISILAISYFLGLFIACMVSNLSENQARKRKQARNIKRLGRELKHSYKAFREVQI